MDDTQKRQEMVAGLRALATLLEEHESMPVPYYGAHAIQYLDVEQARKARKGIHGWRKYNEKTSSYISYRLCLAGRKEDPSVSLMIEVPKQGQCERVQTGVRHVEASDQPVYEWVCGNDADEEVSA